MPSSTTELEAFPPLPAIGLASRAYASMAVHRLVPLRLAFAALRTRNELLLLRSGVHRYRTTEAMSYLLSESPRRSEIKKLARAYGYEAAKQNELLWRPWEFEGVEVENLDTFRNLRGAGRGAILNFMHHGPYLGMLAALRREGIKGYVPMAPFYFDTPTPGYAGHRDRQYVRNVAMAGEGFSADGGLDRIKKLFDEREVIVMAFDIPGRMRVSFLGRDVLVNSGLVRVARLAQVPIVPVTMHRRGRSLVARVEEPIDPADYSRASDIQQALALVHEPAILAWPEAVEWPLKRWDIAGADEEPASVRPPAVTFEA